MVQVTLTVEQGKLGRLQRELKAAGNGGLTRELNKALRAAAEPVAVQERAAALALPAQGSVHTGLRESIAAGVGVSVTRSDRNPGVRVRSRSRLARASIARSWRHPVFGNRNVWVAQTLSPDWFGRTALRDKAEVAEKVHQAVETIARKIVR